MDNIDTIKKNLLIELENARGIISIACQNVGISRQTYYNYIKDDIEFKGLVDDIQEGAIDHVESKLFEKIDGVTIQTFNSKGDPVIYEQQPSDTAIIFYLKTKGKKRGYVEKTEVDHGGVLAVKQVFKIGDQEIEF